MSVIAWDGKSLAADRQGTAGELRMVAPKLWRMTRHDGEIVIIGTTGDLSESIVVRDWYVSGADPARWPEFQRTDRWARLVVLSASAWLVTFEREPVAIPVLDPFAAWGSGRDFALGAMAHGASARQAVEIACRLSVFCGMGADEFSAEELDA